MAKDQQTYHRAAVAALVGLVTQLVLAIVVALLGIYTLSPAMIAGTWHLFGGLVIWAILWVVFHQHELERTEALEAEALSRNDARTAAIFDEAGEQLNVARKRLDNLGKWWLPIVSLLVGIYLAAVGGTLFAFNYVRLQSGALTENAMSHRAAGHVGVVAIVLVAVAFVGFLVARYVSGMTRRREWTLLRGGASYLMGSMVITVLLFAGALASRLSSDVLMGYIGLIVPAIMMLLGIEVLLGLVLGIYRPRRVGEINRPAFDSRILGWLTRPESIGRIVGEAINYQFGFEVSSSWFYRMLARAIVPLVIIAAAVLIGLTSLVVVAPQQQAVITRWGGLNRIVNPGAHWKWPWPAEKVTPYDVYRVHQIILGSDTGPLKPNAALLWTNNHAEATEHFLVTAPSQLGTKPGEARDTVAGELTGARIILRYRIDNLRRYVTTAGDPVALLSRIAARRINHYFVSHTIDYLLTKGRIEAGDTLRQQIQHDVATPPHALGIEVVLVGFAAIHPPQKKKVADKFHEMIDAAQEEQSTIQDAEKNATQTLAQVAGSRRQALEIADAIADVERSRNRPPDQSAGAQNGADRKQPATGKQRDSAGKPNGSAGRKNGSAGRQRAGDSSQQSPNQNKIAQQQAKIEKLMDDAGGEAAQLIYQARAYRWQHALTERARYMATRSEYPAYQAAPDYFKRRLYLNTLAQSLVDPRKTVIAGKKKGHNDIRLDLKTQSSATAGVFGEQ